MIYKSGEVHIRKIDEERNYRMRTEVGGPGAVRLISDFKQMQQTVKTGEKKQLVMLGKTERIQAQRKNKYCDFWTAGKRYK
jgi:hypothetical protein